MNTEYLNTSSQSHSSILRCSSGAQAREFLKSRWITQRWVLSLECIIDSYPGGDRSLSYTVQESSCDNQTTLLCRGKSKIWIFALAGYIESDGLFMVITPNSAQPFLAIPPLENGDRLSRSEFERRYQAMPDVKKAELIEGI